MAGHDLEITAKSAGEVKALTLKHEGLDELADGVEAAQFAINLLRTGLREKVLQKYSTGLQQQVDAFMSENVSEAD